MVRERTTTKNVNNMRKPKIILQGREPELVPETCWEWVSCQDARFQQMRAGSFVRLRLPSCYGQEFVYGFISRVKEGVASVDTLDDSIRVVFLQLRVSGKRSAA